MTTQHAFLLLSFFVLCGACSTTPPLQPSASSAPPSAAANPGIPQNVEIELSYVLGHDHYRLHAWSRQGRLEGKSFMNRKILRSSSRLNRKNFETWARQVQAWVSEKSNSPSTESQPPLPCRSPYWLTLKNDSGIQTVEGCRTSGSDAAMISRMSREGDFLLYSSK